eukprot:scaffold276794_cov33-Tisochrysis_lutea.AAC.1
MDMPTYRPFSPAPPRRSASKIFGLGVCLRSAMWGPPGAPRATWVPPWARMAHDPRVSWAGVQHDYCGLCGRGHGPCGTTVVSCTCSGSEGGRGRFDSDCCLGGLGGPRPGRMGS